MAYNKICVLYVFWNWVFVSEVIYFHIRTLSSTDRFKLSTPNLHNYVCVLFFFQYLVNNKHKHQYFYYDKYIKEINAEI